MDVLNLNTGGSSYDNLIAVDANTLAIRNGVNAQELRVYNTYTDASNYERGFARWSSDVFYLGSEAAGTGTARTTYITSDADTVINAATGSEVSLRINNASLLEVNSSEAEFDVPICPRDTADPVVFKRAGGDSNCFQLLPNTGVFTCVNNTMGLVASGVSSNIELTPGSDIVEQKNGTDPQSHYWCNTHTDASNYERGYARWESNAFRVGCESAGTGSTRRLQVEIEGQAVIQVRSSRVNISQDVICEEKLEMQGGSFEEITDQGNSGSGTVTCNCNHSNVHTITLDGNPTLALSNDDTGQTVRFRLVQDATGSRTVTWFAGISWAGGSAPTLTTTANKTDVIEVFVTGTGTYDGYIIAQNI